jgi:hypothetical protein
MEAEALDQNGQQEAAIIWARGADALTSKPKVSSAGDAYDLAKSFADDFSKQLVKAASPFDTLPSLLSMQAVYSMLGGAPKEATCDRFGRGPGICRARRRWYRTAARMDRQRCTGEHAGNRSSLFIALSIGQALAAIGH